MRTLHIQIAFGGKNRFAARDYYEHPSSGDTLLSPMAARNQRAVWDEDVFRDRFGFDAPAEQRQDVIDLQCHWDLTNKEIATLYTGGCLTLGKGVATCLCARIKAYAWGYCFLVCSVLCTALASLRLLPFSANTSTAVFFAFSMYGAAVLLLWFSSRVCFDPIGILRSRGLPPGQQWVLSRHQAVEN